MKKFLIIAPLLLIASCTTKEVVYMPATTVETTAVETTAVETTVETTVPEPETSVTLSTSTKELLYLSTVKDNTLLSIYFDDDFLLDFAYLVCDFFRTGGTQEELFNTIIQVVYENNLSESVTGDLAYAAGAGIIAFCPEYESSMI